MISFISYKKFNLKWQFLGSKRADLIYMSVILTQNCNCPRNAKNACETFVLLLVTLTVGSSMMINFAWAYRLTQHCEDKQKILADVCDSWQRTP